MTNYTNAELENLYLLARRAKETGNSEHAENYYNQIVIKDPSSWEASFYSVYYQSMNCKIAGITSAAISLSNCQVTILKLINNIEDLTERNNALNEVITYLQHASKTLKEAAINHYYGIDPQIRGQYYDELQERERASENILFNLTTNVASIFGKDYAKLLIDSCKELISFYVNHLNNVLKYKGSPDRSNYINLVNKYIAIVKKIDESYIPPVINEPTTNMFYIGFAAFAIIVIVFIIIVFSLEL